MPGRDGLVEIATDADVMEMCRQNGILLGTQNSQSEMQSSLLNPTPTTTSNEVSKI